jgi:hypothetical protein
MQATTIWLKVSGVSLFVGGDPVKGQPPVITAKLEKPQIIIDPEKATITIVETK